MYVPGPRLVNWYEPLLAVTVVATGVLPPFLIQVDGDAAQAGIVAVDAIAGESLYFVPLMQMFWKLSKLLPEELVPLVATIV